MPTGRPLIIAMLCAALLLLAGAPAAAQSSGTQIIEMEITAGFGGRFRESHWVPVRIRVRNSGADIDGRLAVRPATSGRLVTNTFSTPVELPRGSEKTLFLYVMVQHSGLLVVDLLGEDDVLVTSQSATVRALQPQDQLSVVVTAPGGAAIPLNTVVPGGYEAAQAIWEPASIPDSAAALSSVDLMMFDNVDTAALTTAQRQALTQWVTAGGHLLVTGGPAWQGTSDALTPLLPFRPQGSTTVDELTPLARFSGDHSAVLRAPTVISTGIVGSGAQVLAELEGQPLLVRGRYGGGTVDYLAADPRLAPLRTWDGLPQLWFALRTTAHPLPPWTEGFVDNTEGAISIVILPGADLLPAVAGLCLFLGVYVLVIGPLNYAVLARMRRREWAWFSIPLFIVLFSVLAWAVGFNLRGSEATISRVSLVQAWPDSEQAQVQQLLGLLSPRRATYSIQMPQDVMLRLFPVVRGSIGSDFTTAQAGTEIVQDASFRAESFSVDGGIFANFSAQGVVPHPAISGRLTRFYRPDGTEAMQGSVRNDGQITLKDPVLLARGLSYRLEGDFGPGDLLVLNSDHLVIDPEAGWISASALEHSLGPQAFGFGAYGSIIRFGRFDSWQTIRDVLGSDYQPTPRDLFNVSAAEDMMRRRLAFLSSFMRDQYNATGRGSHAYLVGWTDESPLGLTVEGAGWTSIDSSLYIVELNVAAEYPPPTQEVTVRRDAFTWLATERSGITEGTPSVVTLFPDTAVTFQFTPLPELVLDEVTELSFTYSQYASFRLTVFADLWNWETGEWERIVPSASGTMTVIPEPARFLGPGNSVQIRFWQGPDSVATARLQDIWIEQRGYFLRG